MSFMSVWAKYLEVDFFGEKLLAGKSTKTEWIKPVFADDVLKAKNRKRYTAILNKIAFL